MVKDSVRRHKGTAKDRPGTAFNEGLNTIFSWLNLKALKYEVRLLPLDFYGPQMHPTTWIRCILRQNPYQQDTQEDLGQTWIVFCNRVHFDHFSRTNTYRKSWNRTKITNLHPFAKVVQHDYYVQNYKWGAKRKLSAKQLCTTNKKPFLQVSEKNFIFATNPARFL